MKKLIAIFAVLGILCVLCCGGGFVLWMAANPETVAEIKQQSEERLAEQKKKAEQARIQAQKQEADERAQYDGRTIDEWNKLTRTTTEEESGVVYNVTLATLKKFAARPSTVKMVGGHRVKPLGCELSMQPRYQSHTCKGRFKFKNSLGIEDEESYTLYFRKFEDGEVKLAIVEIGGQAVYDIDANN